jgi:caffeoyl-CoA O-methyltransferase
MKWCREQTEQHLKQGFMVSGNLVAQTLQFFIALTKPKRCLEIGTYTGYTALAIAQAALAEYPGATLTCLDSFVDEPESERICREVLETRCDEPLKSAISLVKCSSALASLEEMSKGSDDAASKFDFVFIDADKESQIQYVEILLEKLLNVGGLIAVDNTLWYSKVLEAKEKSDAMTQCIQEFNDWLLTLGDRVQVMMLPVRDGVTIIRKLK